MFLEELIMSVTTQGTLGVDVKNTFLEDTLFPKNDLKMAVLALGSLIQFYTVAAMFHLPMLDLTSQC